MMSRPRVEYMDEIIGEEVKVLDHGFIRVIDYMGDDAAIVQAARVSYGKGTKSVREDEGLINYLMRHKHSTPFEMCEIKLHVKLPIFVARQWIRHRTGSFNEYSARYSIMDKEFYIPSSSTLGKQSSVNKQGRGELTLSEEDAHVIQQMIEGHSERSYSMYETLLNEGSLGLARELARMVLPLNFYSQWYWKVDLKNLLDFLNLRTDPHAQYEIRVYAEEIEKILSHWLPITYGAYKNHMKHGVSFSSKAMEVMKSMMAGDMMDQETSGLSKREWNEFTAQIGFYNLEE